MWWRLALIVGDASLGVVITCCFVSRLADDTLHWAFFGNWQSLAAGAVLYGVLAVAKSPVAAEGGTLLYALLATALRAPADVTAHLLLRAVVEQSPEPAVRLRDLDRAAFAR
jgi:hypothetical protein